MIWAENFVRIFLPYKNVINGNIDEFADEHVRQLIDAIHAQGAKYGTQTDIMGSAFYGEVSARGGRDAQYFALDEIDYMVDSYVAAVKKFKAWGLKSSTPRSSSASCASTPAVASDPPASAARLSCLRRSGCSSLCRFALCRFPRCLQRRCGRISDADFIAPGASCVMCRPCHVVKNAPAPRYSRAVWCPLCTK